MGNKDTIEVIPPEDNYYYDQEPLDQEPLESDDKLDCEEGQEPPAQPVKTSTRKRKKRRKKHYFLRFLVFCAIVAGLIAFLTSSYFDLKTIQIEGNVNYTVEDVIALSKVETGGSIFKVKKSKVLDNLKQDSYVESVKIRRKFPSTLIISIVERKEIAAIPYGEEYIIIDKAGYVLNRVDQPPQLTALEGLTIKDMKKGHKIQVKEEDILEKTLELLNAMEYSDLFFKKIDMSNVIISAYIYDTLVCRGTPENIMKNMNNGNLEIILYDLYKKGITEGSITVGNDQYCAFSPNI